MTTSLRFLNPQLCVVLWIMFKLALLSPIGGISTSMKMSRSAHSFVRISNLFPFLTQRGYLDTLYVHFDVSEMIWNFLLALCIEYLYPLYCTDLFYFDHLCSHTLDRDDKTTAHSSQLVDNSEIKSACIRPD